MKKILLIIALAIFFQSGSNLYAFAQNDEIKQEQVQTEQTNPAEISEKLEQTEQADSTITEENTPVIEAKIEFEWVNMDQVKRDEKIEYYRNIVFNDETSKRIPKKEFRDMYKDFLKDSLFRTHYRLISNGAQETKEYNTAGFFRTFRGEPLLYAYALQPKDDLRHAYYYNAFGTLAYVDDMSENYPNYPYYSKQYRANGKLAGVIYFESKHLQYTYAPDSNFKGVWYKDSMYDSKGKKILTRTNW